jgi:trehalose 6-phosphate synthase/phosphatase
VTPRLILASLRLPVTARRRDGRHELVPSVGGLATGLASVHDPERIRWIGWTGLPPAQATPELERDLAHRGLVSLPLDAEEIETFYHGYANTVLWPVFHGQLGRLPLALQGWDAYERVNQRFAARCAEVAEPGDMVWVHDYQLCRMPHLLRQLRPDLRIGFFLHIPFPPPELFAVLAEREALLEGMLGADLIGVHTNGYLRNVEDACRGLLRLAPGPERLTIRGRTVRLGVFPMGVDAARFGDRRADATAVPRVEGSAMLLGIDRLDYTKGIPRRLLAFEQLLERHPDRRGHVHLVQIAVPSRGGVRAYQRFRDEVEGLVGRINGRFGTPAWTPVQYIHRAIPFRQLLALYRGAAAMLVTPVRDGLNLVAKEFVAARIDDDGVLVLSEFTGAADELSGALLINPYDVSSMAETFHRALTMPAAERRERMQRLRARVLAYDANHWVRDFLAALSADPPDPLHRVPVPIAVPDLVATIEQANAVDLLIDYDGTLVPFAERPDLAAPPEDLLQLLRDVAARPGVALHLVSGRSRDDLERWFGSLPIGLYAEHALWMRQAGASDWQRLGAPRAPWREAALTILQRFTERTPGALIEEKSVGLAWHYRQVDEELGAGQAAELELHLRHALAGTGAEVLSGDFVIEIRPQGAHKGNAVLAILARSEPGALIVALGDDRTDDDMFDTLPSEGLAVAVSPRPRRAGLRLASVAQVREVLARLAGHSGGDRD